MKTAIINANIFNGEVIVPERSIIIEDGYIVYIGDINTDSMDVIDAEGCTVFPGLFDCHTHTSVEDLALSIKFGVTTELEMMGHWTAKERAEVAARMDIADVRSAGFGVTPPGGHPDELMPDDDFVPEGAEGEAGGPPPEMPTVTNPLEAVSFVRDQVANGADYIKVMIEDGHVLAAPGLPLLSDETLIAAVAEAHRYNKLVMAHVLTVEAARQAVRVGVDGLAHTFIDKADDTIINEIAEANIFVVPCLSLASSIYGNSAVKFADDPRVSSKLSKEWITTLQGSFNTYPEGKIKDVLASTKALKEAGVDILTGTDVSVPFPSLGGLAHGFSVHHEMQLLVEAGLTPSEAITAATVTPAKRFGLYDRGRVAVGKQADLVMVEGDPTKNIDDTLNIRDVWRKGVRLNLV